MNTSNFTQALTAFLFCFMSIAVFGQQSTTAEFTVNVEPKGNGWSVPAQKFQVTVDPNYEQKGTKYTPIDCRVAVIPLSENKQSFVQKIRYNGKIINIPSDYYNQINAMATFFSYEVVSYRVSVSINGVNYTKDIKHYGQGSMGFNIPFKASLEDKSNFRINDFKVLDVKFDDELVKNDVNAITNFNTGKEKEEATKKKVEEEKKIAEGQQKEAEQSQSTQNNSTATANSSSSLERTQSSGQTQQQKQEALWKQQERKNYEANMRKYNAINRQIAAVDKAHQEFNDAIDKVSESLGKQAKADQQASRDWWEGMDARVAAEKEVDAERRLQIKTQE